MRRPAGEEKRLSDRKTILVVEDNSGVLKLVQVILQADYDVLTADSAEKGLALGLEFPHPIDLLISDVVMPGMYGPELAAQVKEARPQMRVILMSGKVEGRLRVLGGDLLTGQGWRFLAKPFWGPELLALVRAELQAVRGAAG